MESLQEPNMSRTSSTESLDSMATDEFEKFPIYCMQSDTVQSLVKTGESCGELGMVTPPRKVCKLDNNLASEQKSTRFFVKSEPVPASEQKSKSFVAKIEPYADQCLPVPDLSFKFKSDADGKSPGDIILALATTPPAAAAPKPKAKAKAKAKG